MNAGGDPLPLVARLQQALEAPIRVTAPRIDHLACAALALERAVGAACPLTGVP